MKSIIELDSISDLDRFQLRLKQARVMFPAFRQRTMEETAQDTILNEIHTRMRQNNFSEKIIEGTIIRSIQEFPKFVRIWFESKFFAPSGFDVAVAREEGTRDHRIEPINEDGVLRWVEQDGTVRYSKGHDVKGFEALKIVATVVSRGRSKFLKEFNARTERWVTQNLSGGF